MEYPFQLPEGTTIAAGNNGDLRGLTATREFAPGEIITVFRPQAVCHGSEDQRTEIQLYSDFAYLSNLDIRNELSLASVPLARIKEFTAEELEVVGRVTKLRKKHRERIRKGQLDAPKRPFPELATRVHDIYRNYRRISPLCGPMICECLKTLVGFQSTQLSELVEENRAKCQAPLSPSIPQSCFCCSECTGGLAATLRTLFKDSAAQYQILVRVYSCIIVTCLTVEQDGFDFSKYKFFCNHREEMEKAYDVRYLPIVGLLRKVHAARNYERYLQVEELIDLYCIVLTSGFEWQHLDCPWYGVGTGFDPLIAATNHCCNHNASIIDYDLAVRKDVPCKPVCKRCPGHVVVMRALRRIHVGEQITIPYTSARIARHVRRDTLKSMYYFDCHCEACRGVDEIEEAFLCPNCNRPFSLIAQRFKTTTSNGREEQDPGVVDQLWPAMLVDYSDGSNGYRREIASLGQEFLKHPPEIEKGVEINIDNEDPLSDAEQRLLDAVTDPMVNCPRCKFSCDWKAGEVSSLAFQELLARLMNNASAEEGEEMTPEQRKAFETELADTFQRILAQNNSYFLGRHITRRVADRLQTAALHSWYGGSYVDARKTLLLSIFVLNEVEAVQVVKKAEIDFEKTDSLYDWVPLCPSLALVMYFGIFRILDYLSWLDLFIQSRNGDLASVSGLTGFSSVEEFLQFNRIILRLLHSWYTFIKKYETLTIEANHMRMSYGVTDRHIAIITIRMARFGINQDKTTPDEIAAQYLFDLTVEAFGAEPSDRICNLQTWRIVSAVNEL